MDWLSGLTESIGTLNKNIQQNVQQLNQQIQHTVQSNLAQVHRITENLPKDIGSRLVPFPLQSHRAIWLAVFRRRP